MTHHPPPPAVAQPPDTQGRAWPGNPAEARGLMEVQCSSSESIVVRIADSCPCQQKLPSGTVTQTWCCGDQWHMDLSFWAFERLAHPVYGATMIDFRPVDCGSKAVLPLVPGEC